MEAAVVWKAAMKPRLPTRLGKRCAFPTASTAPAAREKQARRQNRDTEAHFAELDVHNCTDKMGEALTPPSRRPEGRRLASPHRRRDAAGLAGEDAGATSSGS